MKLKLRPEDFRVEEVSRPPPADPAGAFQVFRLEKSGVEAFDAIEAIARALGVPSRDVALAGLKDQRSVATQLASARAPGRRFDGPVEAGRGLKLVPLSRAARPVRGEDIERNRFTIVVRDLTGDQAREAPARAAAALRDGLPNYFDDQRMGGASEARGFVAEAWSRGDLAAALEMLIARPSPKDPRRERLEKEAIRARWGRWEELSREVRGEAAPLVRSLARAPRDLGLAFRALDARFRALLVAQYQSWLWNGDALARVRAALPAAALFEVMYRAGTFAFWRSEAGLAHAGALLALRGAEVPFPPVRIPAEIGVAAPEGSRALVLRIDDIDISDERDDELRPGRRRVTMRLTIPRSAYATLVAKRVFYEPPPRPPAASALY